MQRGAIRFKRDTACISPGKYEYGMVSGRAGRRPECLDVIIGISVLSGYWQITAICGLRLAARSLDQQRQGDFRAFKMIRLTSCLDNPSLPRTMPVRAR
jgi:hypothetical protein